jgi:hypothetical protein
VCGRLCVTFASLLTCPAHPSWYVRLLPWTVSHTHTALTHSKQLLWLQATIQKTYSNAGTLYVLPPCLVPEQRILSSDLFQSFECYFQKLCDFQSFECCFHNYTILLVTSLFLSYDIQLCYYFPFMKIWQLNAQTQIISSYWLRYVAPKIYFLQTISNNHAKTCAIPICNNKYQYLKWHPPFLLRPLQMTWRKTLCGACSLRNFTSFVIGMLADTTLRLQKKRKGCIQHTIVIINTAQYQPTPAASPCSVNHWRFIYLSPFKLNYVSWSSKLMAVSW